MRIVSSVSLSLNGFEAEPAKVPIEVRNLALLKQFLKGKRFRLDCGRFPTSCHHFGTTMIIIPGYTPKIICFDCYL